MANEWGSKQMVRFMWCDSGKGVIVRKRLLTL